MPLYCQLESQEAKARRDRWSAKSTSYSSLIGWASALVCDVLQKVARIILTRVYRKLAAVLDGLTSLVCVTFL